jgi:DNA-binding MarR family transcriptional regulator
MQGIITKLERDGYVRRTPHPEHGRIQTTELTENGRVALEAAHLIAAEIETLTRSVAKPLDPNAVTEMLLRVAVALRDSPR